MYNNNDLLNQRNGQEEEPKLRDYLNIFVEGKWIIIISFVIIFGAVSAYTFLSDRIYESTAGVIIRKPNMGSSLGIPIIESLGFGEERKIKNELEILKSNAVAIEVAKRLLSQVVISPSRPDTILIIRASEEEIDEGPFAKLPTILKRLEKSVKFETVRESDVIHIKVRSKCPYEAALIANVFTSAYYDRNMDFSRLSSKKLREFLENQVNKKKIALNESEAELQKFMEEKGIVSIDDESRKIIEVISEFEANKGQAEIELEGARNTLNTLKMQLTDLEPSFAKTISDAVDPYITLLQEQIAQLEVKKDVTIAQNPSAADNPLLQKTLKDLDDQINKLRQKLNEKIDEYVLTVSPNQTKSSSVYDPVGYVKELRYKIVTQQILVSALEAKLRTLQKIINQYEVKFAKIPKTGIDYARYQRARLSNEKLYMLVEEKYQESVIAEQSQFGYIEVFDEASVPIEPVSPNVSFFLLAGLVLGLGFGIGLVLVKHRLDIHIKSVDDIKKLGINVLALIPFMDKQIQKVNGKTIAIVKGKEIDAHLISYINPLSNISEAYRRLRTAIQFINPDKKLQLILVTSPGPKDGKSTTVSNLAITYAQSGKKVVIVDCDLRKPTLHNEFGITISSGVTDYLFGNCKLEDIIKETVVEDLYLITCGEIPPNPSELAGSQKMKNFLDELRKKFDIILLDSPPLLAVTDAEILSSLSDGVVLVVRSKHTILASLERAQELLKISGAWTLGVLVNAITHTSLTGRYGYYAYKYNYTQYGGDDGGVKKKKKSVQNV